MFDALRILPGENTGCYGSGMKVINNRLWIETDTYVYTDNQCNVLTAEQLSNPDCVACVSRVLVRTMDPYEYEYYDPNKPRNIRLQVALIVNNDQGYFYRDGSAECMYGFLLKLSGYSFSSHDVVCGADAGIFQDREYRPYKTLHMNKNEWSKKLDTNDLDETSRYFTNGSSLPGYEIIKTDSGKLVYKDNKWTFLYDNYRDWMGI